MLSDPEQVTRVLGEILAPLVKDQKDGGLVSGTGKLVGGDRIDWEEWKAEQADMAKVIHLMRDPNDPDQCFLVLNAVRKQLGEGGVDRIKYTLPSLVNSSLLLARKYRVLEGTDDLWEKKLQTLFKFTHQTVAVLHKSEHHELALRLFLLPLQNPVILVGFEMVAYEFMVQAFTIYEEAISESKNQIAALHLMMGTLWTTSNTGVFTLENYDTLVTKTALYASKLLKKTDQCRLVYTCSHLFWGRDLEEEDSKRILAAERKDTGTESSVAEAQRRWFYRDGKRVLECLQKSLKIADSCMDSILNASLFIEILNVYVIFYEKGNPSVCSLKKNRETWMNCGVLIRRRSRSSTSMVWWISSTRTFKRCSRSPLRRKASMQPTLRAWWAMTAARTRPPTPPLLPPPPPPWTRWCTASRSTSWTRLAIWWR